MGWLDRLREGLEEALAAEQAALREEAGTRPRPIPADDARPPPGAAPAPAPRRPPADDPWPPPGAAPAPAPRRPPADDPWPPPGAAPAPAPRRPPADDPWPPPGAAPASAPRRPPAGPVGEKERRRSLPARLRDPGVLREAFVVKEILDRPLGLRPVRDRLRP